MHKRNLKKKKVLKMVQPVRINHAGALIAEDKRVLRRQATYTQTVCAQTVALKRVLIFQLKSL